MRKQTKNFSCFIRCGFVRGCCTYNDKYGNLQSSGGSERLDRGRWSSLLLR